MATPDYFALSKQLLAQVTRWEHATFIRNHLEPAECERSGWTPGRVLKKATKGAYSYGFAADGKLLIARTGQHEELYVWSGDVATELRFDRSAITWAVKQRWSAAEQKKAARLVNRARFVFAKGRLARIERGKHLERFHYDRDDRVVKVTVSEPRHTDELSYDATGQLVRVVYRHPNGKAFDKFRRAPRTDRLAVLLPEIQAALLAEIPRVLARAKLRAPVYCLAISTCLEEAPHLLPPRLTLGLVADRDARIAKGGPYVHDDLWLPDSLPLFDDARLEMRGRAIVKLCDRANVAREDDAPVVAMLRRLAAQLQTRGLADVLVCAPDFLVYAMDIGGESAEGAARRAAKPPLRARLKKLGAL